MPAVKKVSKEKIIDAAVEVLRDGFDQEAMQFVGRSYAESPDIDGCIYFTADHEVEVGQFVPVRITGAMDGELTGELAE